MDFDHLDEHVSVSEDSGSHSGGSTDEEFEDDDLEAGTQQAGAQDGGGKEAVAAVAAAAAAFEHTAPAASRAMMTDALISGEVSTQAALLQMEVSELLSEVAAARQQAKQAVVQTVVGALRAALSTLPHAQVSAAAAAAAAAPAAAAGALQSLAVSLGPDAQATCLAVAPPASVQLVGSWADGSAVALPGAAVDVAVQLPSSCLHHKDHLNFRYHTKRALYLSQLSQHLAAHPAFRSAQQQVAALQGDPYRPALLLQLDSAALTQLLQLQQQQQHKAGRGGSSSSSAAAAFGSSGLVLRLLPTVGLDCFDVGKLAPSRNNIRWTTAAPGSSGKQKQKQQDVQQQQQQEPDLVPTPHYNAGILADMLLLLGSHRQQQAAFAAGMRFTEAAMLLKLWAQQHGLSTQGVLPPAAHALRGQQQQQPGAGSLLAAAAVGQADGFSGHLLSALLTAAVQKAGDAAAAMSSLQLFKSGLQLLADKQAWSKGGGLSLLRDSAVPAGLRQQQQQQPQLAAVEGKVAKDQAKLLHKLQQQLHSLQAPSDAAAAFRKAYDVTFLDSSGHLNLAAGVSSMQLHLAQAAAQQSLTALNRQDLQPDAVYAAVFKPGQGLARVFHYCWTVELPASSSGSSSGSTQQQLPGDQHPMRLEEVEVEGLVRAALGSRARLVKALRRTPVLLLHPGAGALHNQQQQMQQKQQKKAKHGSSTLADAAARAGGSSGSSAVGVPRRVVVCAVVDPVAVLRLVDVGPAADDAAAAAKFRKLWGDKSELRRFQDGKICEAIVWEGVTPGQRHRIPDLAVSHVLQRHLPAGTVITSCAAALDSLLYASSEDDGGSQAAAAAAADNVEVTQAAAAAAAAAAAGSSGGGTGSGGSSVAVSVGVSSSSGSSAAAEETAASRAADAALESLTKQLRALSDLALKVIGVQPLSCVTRHTCCFYPEPHPLAEGSGARAYTPGAKVPRVLEAVDVMVQLESTGKMPLHPEAFAKTKAALGVQLAAALSAACGAHVTATEEALEVLWQGFAFKLILYLDRENKVLLAPTATAASSSSSTIASSGGSSGQQALPVLLSQHHGLVSALSAAHAAYAPTVRLAKRWLAAHLLLGGQVCEEAVELLVGAAFQGPSTAPPPASRMAGFLSFLHLLASHPWSASALLLDPTGEVQQEARSGLQAEVEALRSVGSAPAMFIATPYDLHTSRWTAQQPRALATSHLVSLARATWHSLSQLLLLGADAPAVQQQLVALTQQQQQPGADASDHISRKRSKQQEEQQEEQEEEVRHLEAHALGRAWRSLCVPLLSGFDAVILLRKEALPFADRADPLAVLQLQQLVAQQHRQQRRLAGGGSSSKKKHKQQQQQGGPLQVLLARPGAGGGVQCAAPKNSRAILRDIPEQVLLSKPAERLRSELLVGFDPVTHYLSLLTQRYGHLAQFCGDSSSSFPAIGIKWHAAAFLPAPLRPNLAHAQVEVCLTTAAAAGGSKGGKGSSQGLVVPNLPQVLSEVAEMGLGLVEEVLLL